MRHQEFDQARELFPRALKEGKLVEYLGGFPGYDLFDPYADSPTDPDAAFRPISALIIEDQKLKDQVFAALLSLVEDKEYGWMSIYYIHELKFLEKQNGVGLMDSNFVGAIAKGLRENKAYWDMNTKWVGKSHRGGLWGAVRGINRMLHKDYNLTILPEELEPTSPNPAQP